VQRQNAPYAAPLIRDELRGDRDAISRPEQLTAVALVLAAHDRNLIAFC
jgi:hypothetical protein